MFLAIIFVEIAQTLITGGGYILVPIACMFRDMQRFAIIVFRALPISVK